MSIEVVEIKDDKPAEVNFGVGVEMLMNDKKKPENNKSNSSDMGMKELEKLESTLSSAEEEKKYCIEDKIGRAHV